MTNIIITGVSRGLGKAMVGGFAASDCRVAGCARSSRAIAQLQEEFGSPHRFDVVDVASDAAVKQWADSVLASHGPPDYLINNAALINTSAPLWEVSAADFDQLTAVNINGTVNTIRHLLPAMMERGSGTVVNFSSGWGRSVSADVAPYCASKWAIEGLTQALAEDLPPGLTAVPLNPGIIDTEMLQSCFGSGASSYPDPDDWATRAVPFILNIRPTDSGRPLTVPGG